MNDDVQRPAATNIDPFTAEIMRNYLLSTVKEMVSTTVRTAYSTCFSEGEDFTCGLFDRHGNMIAQGAGINVHAGGLSARRLRDRAPFDLVFANILLPPLKRLAAPIAQVLAPGAHVVLSGLLAAHAPAALAAYGAQGLRLAASIPLDEWVTLVLTRNDRPGRKGRAAPIVAGRQKG